MLNPRVLSRLLLALGLTGTYAAAQEGRVVWLRFAKSFIQTHYPTSIAIGDLPVQANGATPAGTVHKRSCSGDDGELHIGILNSDLTLAQHAEAPSLAETEGDNTWGLVAELPNAAMADGPSILNESIGKRLTFHGYFRVWNEGHDHGKAAPSNPHHVFELHPAWQFTGSGTDFNRPDLVKAIPAYSGYGLSKLRPIIETIASEDWLTGYADGENLVISLRESPNFLQFPAIIKTITSATGGHEGTMDIYTNTDYQTLLRENVRFVTVTGSALDTKLAPEQRLSLLGFFSINLRRALDRATSAHSENAAVSVPDALEFFVFGKPLNAAVKDSQCDADPEDQ